MRKRRLHRRERKRCRNIIVFSICLVFLGLSIGYAAFSTGIVMNAKGNVKEMTASQLLKTKVVTSGEGLYKDYTEEGRYVYRGTNPDNYLNLGNDMYRIIAVEKDNTLKMVKNESIGKFQYDTIGSRYEENTYCGNSSLGCDWWCNRNDTLNENLQNISYVQNFSNTDTLVLPSQSSSINKYLNEEYILTLNSKYIEKHIFNIGYVGDRNGDANISLIDAIKTEKLYKWQGYVGLINVSDYMKATLDSCKYIHDNNCGNSNYLNDKKVWATINTAINNYEKDFGTSIRYTNGKGSFNMLGCNPNYEYEIYPVFFLSSNISLKGYGTENRPYVIVK